MDILLVISMILMFISFVNALRNHTKENYNEAIYQLVWANIFLAGIMLAILNIKG